MRITYVYVHMYYRYSSRVDMYVSKISACLKDESVLVRKQTLTLLTHLLQVSNYKYYALWVCEIMCTLVCMGATVCTYVCVFVPYFNRRIMSSGRIHYFFDFSVL